MNRKFSNAERTIMSWLGLIFDMVVILLGALIMVYVLYIFIQLVIGIFKGFEVDTVLQGIVLILILLEIFEIVTLYFLYHHVSMKNVVELGVLALVKELLITLDLKAFGWEMLIAIAALIFSMGIIYVLEMHRIDSREEVQFKNDSSKKVSLEIRDSVKEENSQN